MISNLMINPLFFWLAGLIGMTVFGYYAKLRCDPIYSGIIKSPNQVFFLFTLVYLSYRRNTIVLGLGKNCHY